MLNICVSLPTLISREGEEVKEEREREGRRMRRRDGGRGGGGGRERGEERRMSKVIGVDELSL